MKCRSVACIWSGTPPLQRVTATAVLNHPPTLYTGGSDGSIFWWNLSSTDSNMEIRPVAMLCGHAMPIADLGVCNPVIDGKTDSSSNAALSSNSDNYGALISACTDGVLCVWSRSSGHCRRRRKLPPWVGSPSVIRTLPSNSRYVCIACSFTNGVHLFDYHDGDVLEKSEPLLNAETHDRKPSKCTIVIVDTYTLTIIQTVFHGKLSIGPLKCMVVVSSTEDGDKLSALMADSSGKLQLVPMSRDSYPDKEDVNGSPKSSSHLEMTVWSDCVSEGEKVVSISSCRGIIALVLRNCCIFKLVSGATVGEISFPGKHLCLEGDKLHVVGGMFLESVDAGNMLKTQESCEMFSEKFIVWNNKGSAVVYMISYFNEIYKFESMCEIPAASCPLDVRLSVSFVPLDHYLLRIESVYSYIEEPVQWKPRVTIWSLHEKSEHGNSSQQCKMLGEGGFLVDMFAERTMFHEFGGSKGCHTELASQQCPDPSLEYVNNVHPEYEHHGFLLKGRLVSSSMVISENLYTPYAIVYGFCSGEIEVVRLDMFHITDSHSDSPCHIDDSDVRNQKFLGHTGAVLCLAAHRMINTTKEGTFDHVLLSGSMDCTIRIWDLHSGYLITVMHQHVAPVRQIILPPAQTDRPWNDCFLSVGEDACVALASLETLRAERMFPGHPTYPAKVVWDGARGYIACLCQKHSGTSDAIDVLYIWDVKTGARERVLRGTASHSMFDHFCRAINLKFSGTFRNGDTSVSSLLHPIFEDLSSWSHPNNMEKGFAATNRLPSTTKIVDASKAHANRESSAKLVPITPVFQNKHPIKCSCPFPGIATLSFDLSSLMFLGQKLKYSTNSDKQDNTRVKEQLIESPSPHPTAVDGASDMCGTSSNGIEENDWRSLEECMLQFSLSFLHLWNVDCELDQLLIADMKLKKPENFILATGMQGDKGSLTLAFPDLSANLQLWKSSSEFCAMRSLTMVSLAQRMISLSQSSSPASSALAAFYTRNFSDKIPDVKPPLLQLLVSFWQDESEHVRMAARSLFHCAATRAIPLPLHSQKSTDHSAFFTSVTANGETEHEGLNVGVSTNRLDFVEMPEMEGISQMEESKILAWLESYEMQDWISCVGGTSQDAMTSHIIVAAALAVWYPSLVKPSLAMLVVHPLVKLVMAMNERYSSTAAELLAEGMENTWKECIGSEIPHLIEDILFQVECVSGVSADSATQHRIVPVTIRETLVEILLPSLAMADILGFLTVVESHIWSTASDSPVHSVSLMTLVRVVRGSPRNLAHYLDKAVNFILQTMDPTNSVMRRTCFHSSMTALKEVVRVFPMVALNNTSSRLAVGDAVGEITNATIRVYDMHSVTKLKVLDASGPAVLPSLVVGASEMAVTTVISALCFSPDGEGLVAFSEHGLMIRWWSLGSVWWEKLSRNYVPVQCTKLIFVPPWEGFSPTTARTSIMASIMGHAKQDESQENAKGMNEVNSPKLLIRNLDLSYRLEWIDDRKVLLTRHGQELGTFLL